MERKISMKQQLLPLFLCTLLCFSGVTPFYFYDLPSSPHTYSATPTSPTPSHSSHAPSHYPSPSIQNDTPLTTTSSPSPYINVSHTPSSPSVSDSVVIEAEVSTTISLDRVRLNYTASGTSRVATRLMHHRTTGDDTKLYDVEIGTFPVGTTVSYYGILVEKQVDPFHVEKNVSATHSFTVQDTDTPFITNVSWSPLVPTESDDIIVKANIGDDSMVDAWVNYSTNNFTTFQVKQMERHRSTYHASLGAFSEATIVWFRINASDSRDRSVLHPPTRPYYRIRVKDSSPPSISNVKVNPGTPSPREELNVTALITDTGGVSYAILHYSYSTSTSWISITMEKLTIHSEGNITYIGRLGMFPANVTIQYYVEAVDTGAHRSTYPTNAPDNYLEPTVVDSDAPYITEVQHYPLTPSETTNVIVNVSVADNVESESVTLYYKSKEETVWTSDVMDKTTGSTYEKSIPVIDKYSPGTHVLYYIEATDINDNYITAPQNAKGRDRYYMVYVKDSATYSVASSGSTPTISDVNVERIATNPSYLFNITANVAEDSDGHNITAGYLSYNATYNYTVDGVEFASDSSDIFTPTRENMSIQYTGGGAWQLTGQMGAFPTLTKIKFRINVTDENGDTTMQQYNWTTYPSLYIQDERSPKILSVYSSPLQPTENQQVTFNAHILDNVNVSTIANVTLKFNNGSGWTKTYMEGYEPFFHVKLSSFSVQEGKVQYFVKAWDIFGNSNTSKIKTLKVTDKQSPNLESISYHPSSPTSRNVTSFEANLTDNDLERLSKVTIFYSLNPTKGWFNHILEYTGLYGTDGNLEFWRSPENTGIGPFPSAAVLTYKIVAVDREGNVKNKTIDDITIADWGPPGISDLERDPLIPATQETTQISAIAIDDTDIQSSTLYWNGVGTRMDRSNYLFTVPIGGFASNTSIFYHVNASDLRGYTATEPAADQASFTVVDKQPPTFENVKQEPNNTELSQVEETPEKIEIYANISDDLPTNIFYARLHYILYSPIGYIKAEGWKVMEVSNTYPTLPKTTEYNVNFTEFNPGDSITYQIAAVDELNNRNSSITYRCDIPDTLPPHIGDVDVSPTADSSDEKVPAHTTLTFEAVEVYDRPTPYGKIKNVKLSYKINSDSTFTNITIEQEGNTTYVASLSKDLAPGDNLTYMVTATDYSENQRQYPDPEQTLQVVDVEGPIISRLSYFPPSPSEKDILSFSANVTDEVGVQSVTLFYKNYTDTPNVSWRSAPMSPVHYGGENYSVDLRPFPSNSTIQYYVKAVDTEGNVATTDVHQIMIKDQTAPWIGELEVEPPREKITAQTEITVLTEITDNFAVDLATLHYTQGVQWQEAAMEQYGDRYRASIGPFPPQTNLSFYISAHDPADNINTSQTYSIYVQDKTQPRIMNVSLPQKWDGNEKVQVNVTATDNYEIREVGLFFKFEGDRKWHNTTLEDTDQTRSYFNETEDRVITGIIYSATLQLFKKKDVQLYVNVTDYSDNFKLTPSNAPSQYYTISLIGIQHSSWVIVSVIGGLLGVIAMVGAYWYFQMRR